MSYPDMFVRIIDWSKQVLHVITNSLTWPTFRHLQSEKTGMKWLQVTSHDLWQSQRLPWSLSAARRVMMALPPSSVIITTQNISLPLKRETVLLVLYIYEPSHKEEGKLTIPSKRPTDLSLPDHGWQHHRRVRPDTLSGSLLQVRLSQEPILVEIVRPSIW